MILVYTAGPFTGGSSWKTETNVRRAEELALSLWKAGYAVICPQTNTRFFEGEVEYEQVMQGCFETIGRCDAMVLCPGWEKSAGTAREVEFCRAFGIPVYCNMTQLLLDMPPQ